jgi:hypothetical protein
VTAGTSWAADRPISKDLTPQQIAEGWIKLFDGETTFGWKVEGDSSVKNGRWTLGGGGRAATAETTILFGPGTLQMVFRPDSGADTGQLVRRGNKHVGGSTQRVGVGEQTVVFENEYNQDAIRFACEPASKLVIEGMFFKPLGLQPIFNGKDLAGWKRYTGDERRAKSKFTVTPEGWINVKNGPGDLQTEKQWADFVFQGECISNGKALNSGVFFRCIPGQYQNGYEYQIHNGFKNDDRAKPADFGTGAIYRRVPARKVVPNDHEWFTMTLIAQGRHIRTWVNGYPTVDWTDERKENDNARNGCKLGAGPISLQGHDPTTDLSFRNLRVAELKKE